MAQKRSFGLPIALLLLASLGAAVAQTPASRLAGDWRSTDAVKIPASQPPMNLTAMNEGPAPAGARLERMLLLLAPSAAQQQALTAELGNLQNPASAEYHRWLTPAAFADAYANSAEDVAAVAAWLQSEGFQVAPLPAGRGWIEFSGTAAEVEQAFHTQVESVATAGGTRAVLAGDISVPAALQPLVQGLVSLDGAVSTAALTTPLPVSAAAELEARTSLTNAEALTPQLAAQLLHLDTLHASGVNGTGETIAIAARSNVSGSDVAAFRTAFALPASPLKIVLNGADPGLTSDQAAATLAASWAGAAAPGAQIVLVPAATTGATDGVDLSLAAIVDQALAHTVAVGHSACEAALSPAHQAFYSALYRQAAAEGMAVIAASGDSGPAACHAAGSDAPVSSGYGVNALASTPWNTAVGVAAFGAGGPAAGSSALAAWSPASAADAAYAGGGGSSTLYAAPSWQPIPTELSQGTGKTAIHNRLLPDVALPVAAGTSGNPGLAFCLSGSTLASGCTLVRSGGSSAAAALFAGVAALVAQKNGAQGNLAPNLYALSRESGIFSDVREGSAQLKCVAGSPGCGATEQIGFAASAGYDLATGLGAVNAQYLVSEWTASPQAGTGAVNVSLTVSPIELNSTYNPSAVISLTATVLSMTGGAMPTGTVVFYDVSTGAPLSATPSAVDSNGNAALTTEGVFASGGNEIVAQYSGDGTYEALSSQPPVNINMQPSTTSLAVVPSTYSPAPGATITVTVTLTVGGPPAGSIAPAGVVTLNLDGLPTSAAQLVTASGATTATFSLVVPAVSTLQSHTLQAVYAGTPYYSGSTSPQITFTVIKGSTSTVVTPATLTPAAGSSLKVTASITASNSGTGQPTGTVNFTLDGTSVGTGTVSAGSPATASITIPVVAAGSHVLDAIYSGDTYYTGSTSPAVAISAAKGATLITVTATPPVLAAGGTEILTATLAPLNAVSGITYTITGTVSFYDGALLLGAVPVSSNSAVLTGVKLANNASHTITAVYAGDSNWLGSTSAILPLTATTLPDYVVLTANLAAVPPGQALVLVATVTPTSTPAAGAEQNPAGVVVFYDGTTAIGTAALVPAALGDTSTATLTTQTLPGGQDTLTAFYAGDLYYNAATSNPVTLNVQDFTITPSPTNPPTNLNIVQGSAGSASFIVTGLGGFNNEIQVVCAVPAQDDMTCTATPQQVVPTATVTFVVQTFSSGSGSAIAAGSRRDPMPMWPRAAGGTALAVLLGFFLLPRGKRARNLLSESAGRSTRRFLILLLLLVGLGGVGIGCNSVNQVSSFGTPLGVATLTITASAYVDNTVVSHSVYLNVNVLAKQ
jgi:subtilase family serine protease